MILVVQKKPKSKIILYLSNCKTKKAYRYSIFTSVSLIDFIRKKIINSYKKIFNNDPTIQVSQKILSEYGNVSSVSVLLVLKELIKKKSNGIFLMSALGPGFTAGMTGLKIYTND